MCIRGIGSQHNPIFSVRKQRSYLKKHTNYLRRQYMYGWKLIENKFGVHVVEAKYVGKYMSINQFGRRHIRSSWMRIRIIIWIHRVESHVINIKHYNEQYN